MAARRSGRISLTYSRFPYEKERPLLSPLNTNVVHDLAAHFLAMIPARFRCSTYIYIGSQRNIYIYIYTHGGNSTGRHRAVEQGKTRVVEIPSHVSRITSVHSFYGRACAPIGVVVVFRTRNEVRGSRSRCGARRPLVELEDEGLGGRWNEQEAKVENSWGLSIKKRERDSSSRFIFNKMDNKIDFVRRKMIFWMETILLVKIASWNSALIEKSKLFFFFFWSSERWRQADRESVSHRSWSSPRSGGVT